MGWGEVRAGSSTTAAGRVASTATRPPRVPRKSSSATAVDVDIDVDADDSNVVPSVSSSSALPFATNIATNQSKVALSTAALDRITASFDAAAAAAANKETDSSSSSSSASTSTSASTSAPVVVARGRGRKVALA